MTNELAAAKRQAAIETVVRFAYHVGVVPSEVSEEIEANGHVKMVFAANGVKSQIEYEGVTADGLATLPPFHFAICEDEIKAHADFKEALKAGRMEEAMGFRETYRSLETLAGRGDAPNA